MNTSVKQHQAELETKGWTIVPDVVSPPLTATLAAALAPSLALRDGIRERNGVAHGTDGTLHHLLMDDPCYLQLLSALEALAPIFNAFFEGKYILNSYGGVISTHDSRAYVHEVHRDIRFGTDTKRFMLNALVMLDGFTADNGATHLMTHSQNLFARPSDEQFFEGASRAIGTAGSVLLFDSRIWHAAGVNDTPQPRRALTLTFTCPFFKQQLDYPRLFGYSNAARCDAWLRQLIGFNARVPESLEQFYIPIEQRFYQRGQD